MHKPTTDTLFLLRSYGDFVVALFAFTNTRFQGSHRLIASDHLKPLYDDLCAAGMIEPLSFLRFKDFGIRKGIMSCLTNKHLFSRTTLGELQKLRNYAARIDPADGKIFFEQSARLSLIRFFNAVDAGYVHNGKDNVYDSYATFLRDTFTQQNETANRPASLQILITPGSRKTVKMLPSEMLAQLVHDARGKGHTVTVAGLPSELKNYQVAGREYRSFKELIGLVQETDLLITADSLPAHLAQLAGKPHWILYNHRINHPWLTLHARANGHYATFTAWEKLKQDI